MSYWDLNELKPTYTRKPISKKLRYQVITRDNQTCQYCGAKAPEARLTLDHVIPVSAGGDNELDNLRTACWDCNAGKGTDESYSDSVKYQRLLSSLQTSNCFCCGKEELDEPRFEQSTLWFCRHPEFYEEYIEICICIECIKTQFLDFVNEQMNSSAHLLEQLKICRHKLNPQWCSTDE